MEQGAKLEGAPEPKLNELAVEPSCAPSTDTIAARRLNMTPTEDAKTRQVIQQEVRNKIESQTGFKLSGRSLQNKKSAGRTRTLPSYCWTKQVIACLLAPTPKNKNMNSYIMVPNMLILCVQLRNLRLLTRQSSGFRHALYRKYTQDSFLELKET